MTIKDIEIAAWEEPDGWMEPMKGPRWRAVVKSLQKKFKDAVAPHKDLVRSIQTELEADSPFDTSVELYGFTFSYKGRWHYSVKEPGSDKEGLYGDIEVLPGQKLWAAEDRSSGSEQYTVFHKEKGKLVWTYQHICGPYVAVVGKRCYLLEASNELRYKTVVSVDAATGKDRQVHLTLECPNFNFSLHKGCYGSLFILAANAGVMRLWYLHDTKFEELTGDYESFVPIGFASVKSREPCFFARKSNTDTYEPVGKGLVQQKLPSLENCYPETYLFGSKTLITRSKGLRSVWNTATGKKEEYLATLSTYPLLAFHTGTSPLLLTRPGSYTVRLEEDCKCSYATASYHKATSADGTDVPYILVRSCEHPTSLMGLAYGHYGISTGYVLDRWRPLLSRGWALCVALIRGGGDHTDSWAQAARSAEKQHSMEDYEACILDCRKKLGIPASQTAIYGRSAGGYLVGTCMNRCANGSVFGGVYAEVPFVDVLTGMANLNLPLTEMEADEFGDLRRKPQDFQTVVRLSPIHNLPTGGVPKIFLVARTGLRDRQVFSYEPVKWITRLHRLEEGKAAEPKLVGITGGEGHFVLTLNGLKEQAEDLALFLAWSERHKKSKQGIYNMRGGQQQTRKNQQTKNQQQQQQQGGKRKGRKGTRKTRKSRKTQRRRR